jgi:hypothetical protein
MALGTLTGVEMLRHAPHAVAHRCDADADM